VKQYESRRSRRPERPACPPVSLLLTSGVTLAAVVATLVLSSFAAANTTTAHPPTGFVAIITRVSPSAGNRTERFSFSVVGGTASSFWCTLAHHGKKPAATRCSSPKEYRGLAAGSYDFSVYAVGHQGAHSQPAKNTFSIIG
jgi:hypothetical protein